jgi:hypothetical protein
VRWRPRRRVAAAQHERLLAAVSAAAEATQAQAVELRQAVDALAHDVRETGARHDEQLERVMQALQLVYDDEPANRQRLYALRRSPEYEAAYTDPATLVSIVIPTYDNLDGLRTRGLPSCLGQTHREIEVIVVGDAAPPETAAAIEAIDDPRVRYINRTINGPYPDDKRQRWHVTAGPPFNLGVSLARGRWIAPMADDDALRPDAVERLLALARTERLEAVYGILRMHHADGTETDLGDFPPRIHAFGWQGAIYHAGLRFMEHELADAVFDFPSDWSLARRMLRAGVRFGMLPETTADYYPSYRGA